ncbi:MAG: SDR family oxidoreductase [Coleofasciculus sp. Co-bin14]|jgi:NAD(P)-dependent dehydrogenase (short-subunit alcohol dehydrogenase family)|nr:SDR family oxidoreductase [Coleofasciculus sp. Co-bin14]
MKTEKIALVTGANKGIGFEIVRQLAAVGFRVFLTARDRSRGEAACAKLQQDGLQVEFLQLDVADPSSIAQLAQELASQTDRLDVLVNNAGILLDASNDSILSVDSKVILKTLETNTLGPLRLTQELVPLLTKSNAGKIINVSSGGGQLTDMSDWAPAYSLSKTALNAITGMLAAALRDKNITVNSICPGWVRTDMGSESAPRSVQQGADTVTWLATEAPSDLTGKFLRDRTVIPW